MATAETLMRRGDRLFQLLLELGRGRVRTARHLGERLGVSERTVYRDIADLAAQGTPVEGFSFTQRKIN